MALRDREHQAATTGTHAFTFPSKVCLLYPTLTATPPRCFVVCVCVLSQEDEINKALKSRPKRRQRPGELQREQSMFINTDNLGSTPPCQTAGGGLTRHS